MTYRCAMSAGRESTYGTAVATTRSYEFIDEDFQMEDMDMEGDGYRSGATVIREGNIVRPAKGGKGSLVMQPTSKGMGLLLEELMGAGASVLVPASVTTYQQVFTISDNPPAATWQKLLPYRDLTTGRYLFAGCVVAGFEISMDAKSILSLSIDYDLREATLGGSADALAYNVGTRFSFAKASFATGTFGAPTTTALATAATAQGGVRTWSMKFDRKLDTESPYTGNNSGLKDRPLPNELWEITVTATVEHLDNTLSTSYVAGTPISWLSTFEAEALSSGNATFQIAIPSMRPKGPLPKADKGIVATQLSWKVTDNGSAAQPMWIITRTTDATLA